MKRLAILHWRIASAWRAALVRCIALAGVAQTPLIVMSVSLFTASPIAPTNALADEVINNDLGGEVARYIRKYEHMRATNEKLVIDGPCISSCTLFTGMIPRKNVCVTPRALLGFHAASFYDDANDALVPTRTGTRAVLDLYPPEIRAWIERHGGLTSEMLVLRGRELAELYEACDAYLPQ